MSAISAEDVNRLLPQTQCRQCGFSGCAAYAEAIASGQAPINRCAPGGAAGIERLAKLLGVPPRPLDPAYGREMPFAVARIRAADCIGCGWCVRVCPTDAIAGSPKRLHAVIEQRCTGCALCAPACPIDAVEFVETGTEWTPEDARRARAWFDEAQARDRRRHDAEELRLASRRTGAKGFSAADFMKDIQAIARSRRTKENS